MGPPANSRLSSKCALPHFPGMGNPWGWPVFVIPCRAQRYQSECADYLDRVAARRDRARVRRLIRTPRQWREITRPGRPLKRREKGKKRREARITVKLGGADGRRRGAPRRDLTAKLGNIIGATAAKVRSTTLPSAHIKKTALVAHPSIKELRRNRPVSSISPSIWNLPCMCRHLICRAL